MRILLTIAALLASTLAHAQQMPAVAGVRFATRSSAPCSSGQSCVWVRGSDGIAYLHKSDNTDTALVGTGGPANLLPNLNGVVFTSQTSAPCASGEPCVWVKASDGIAYLHKADNTNVALSAGASFYDTLKNSAGVAQVQRASLKFGSDFGLSDDGTNTVVGLAAVGPGAVTTGGGGQYIASVQTDLRGRIVALTTGTPAAGGTFYQTIRNASGIAQAQRGGLKFGGSFQLTDDGTNTVLGLANSSITVTAGSGLAGGGLAPLGGAVALSLPAVGPGATTTGGGGGQYITSVQTDAQGRVLALTTGAPTVTLPAVGPGAITTGGSGSYISSVQTDAQGRIVTLTSGTAYYQSILSATDIAQTQRNALKFGADFQLSDAASASVVALAPVGPGAGTWGGAATYINSIQTDAQGRIVGLTTGTPAGGGGSFDVAAPYTFTGLHTYANNLTFDGNTRNIGDATHRAATVYTSGLHSGASQMLFTSGATINSATIPAFAWETPSAWTNNHAYTWKTGSSFLFGIWPNGTTNYFSFTSAGTHYFAYVGSLQSLSMYFPGGVRPGADNTVPLGAAIARWSTVFAPLYNAGASQMAFTSGLLAGATPNFKWDTTTSLSAQYVYQWQTGAKDLMKLYAQAAGAELNFFRPDTGAQIGGIKSTSTVPFTVTNAAGADILTLSSAGVLTAGGASVLVGNVGPGAVTTGGGATYINSVQTDAQGRIVAITAGTPAGGGGGGGYTTILNSAGTAQTARTSLKFAADFTATDDGTNTLVSLANVGPGAGTYGGSAGKIVTSVTLDARGHTTAVNAVPLGGLNGAYYSITAGTEDVISLASNVPVGIKDASSTGSIFYVANSSGAKFFDIQNGTGFGVVVSSSSASTTQRHMIIKDLAASAYAYGNYPGGYTPALQIQGVTAGGAPSAGGHLILMSPLDDANNARFYSTKQLDIKTGTGAGAAGVGGGSFGISQTVTGDVLISSNILMNGSSGTAGNSGIGTLSGNQLVWDQGGAFNAPTFTTRGKGAKIILYPNISASTTDWAIGMENSAMWFSVESTSRDFKFYHGTTNTMRLTSTNVVGAYTAAGKMTMSFPAGTAQYIHHPSSLVLHSGTTATDPAINITPTAITVQGFITSSGTATVPPPLPWIAPTLLNSWANYDIANYNGAAYFKDALGFVHLRGFIKSGTTATVMFTLPAGYRPGKTTFYSGVAGTGSSDIRINNNGDVFLSGYLGSGSNTFVALDGAVFYAEM